MQQLSVTRLEPADQDTVVGLLVAQTREHRIQVESESLSQVVARVLSDERYGFLLVARVDRDIVGVAYVATILSVEHGGPVGWVEELYVSPAYRGQGVGRTLLNGALEQAQELGLVALDLEVDVEHERAASLYARFGFRKLMRSRWVRALTPK